MASYVGDLGGNTLPPDVLGGNAVDALVGQRITTGADNVTVLVIAQPSAAIEEITSLAERATDHLTRLKPDDAVMVLEQHGMPPTFVPPEYPLSWVTSVSHRAGGTLSTLTKAKAPFNLSGGRAVGTSGYAPYDPSPQFRDPDQARLSQRVDFLRASAERYSTARFPDFPDCAVIRHASFFLRTARFRFRGDGRRARAHATQPLTFTPSMPSSSPQNQHHRRGRPAARDTVPLSTLVGADAKGKRGGDSLTAAAPKRRKQRLKDFEFGPTELAELAVALRAYVNAKRDTSQPVTSWSNLVARKWPREYALSKQATGVKCTAQKVMAAIDEHLLDRYQETWEWKGGWPAEARAYPPCKISIQHGA
jgi:hypothetical protein